MGGALHRVVILGDAVFGLGVLDVLVTSAFATHVDKVALDEMLPDTLFADADLVIVCADIDELALADRVIRRVSRRRRTVRIAMVTGLPWEDRLDRIGDRTIGACIAKSATSSDLLAVLQLVMAGFFVV